MHIGIPGVGRMGASIATRLMEVGHQVTVWNRSADKLTPLLEKGAKSASSPAELAGSVEVILTILADASAIQSVYEGPSGVLAGNISGKLIIEMSTVLPATQVELAKKVRAKGAAYVECPVGGSVVPAREGKLLGLMGAEAPDVERARPVLEQLCRRVEHCGPVGAGATTKLAINLPLMVAWQAYGEAFAMVRDLGFTPQKLLDLFQDTNGANPALKSRANAIITMLQGGDPGKAFFTIANACKDIRVMLDEAKSRGIELPAVAAALKGFDEARESGLGDGDGAALSVYWSKRK